MQEETINQETSPPISSKPHQPIMQAEAGYQEGFTIVSTITVLLSLDDDHYLRVYKQSDQANQASIPAELYLEIAATDVKRAYASFSSSSRISITPQIVIKATAKTYRFNLSGGAPGLAEFQPLLDDWLDALQQDQFPVRKSRFNDFMAKKVLPHLLLTFMISISLFVVVILIVSAIVMFANGEF